MASHHITPSHPIPIPSRPIHIPWHHTLPSLHPLPSHHIIAKTYLWYRNSRRLEADPELAARTWEQSKQHMQQEDEVSRRLYAELDLMAGWVRGCDGGDAVDCTHADPTATLAPKRVRWNVLAAALL
jgi:hypothetical protein